LTTIDIQFNDTGDYVIDASITNTVSNITAQLHVFVIERIAGVTIAKADPPANAVQTGQQVTVKVLAHSVPCARVH